MARDPALWLSLEKKFWKFMLIPRTCFGARSFASSIYKAHFLERQAANYVPLTPLAYLDRASVIWPDRVAVRFEGRSTTYRELHSNAKRLASALRKQGVGKDDTVTVLSSNSPVGVTAHYGVPGAGAVLHTVGC